MADAFDAMTSDRPYRRGMPFEKALAILEEGKGTQWDPAYVELFVSRMRGEMSIGPLAINVKDRPGASLGRSLTSGCLPGGPLPFISPAFSPYPYRARSTGVRRGRRIRTRTSIPGSLRACRTTRRRRRPPSRPARPLPPRLSAPSDSSTSAAARASEASLEAKLANVSSGNSMTTTAGLPTSRLTAESPPGKFALNVKPISR
ncbi:hypothetical protein [Cohnella ginsengisoli]|uniref:HD-GYP domain-containing protein n=1 Tax=Cohnella ginsengisoli TaxID=425004 RepID=UPI0030B8E1E3